jgi:hypothetical protein
MGQVHDLPVYGSLKEGEAERVAFFERAWAQKHAREAAEAERAKKVQKKAHATGQAAQQKATTTKEQKKQPPKKGVVAQSDDESGDGSD